MQRVSVFVCIAVVLLTQSCLPKYTPAPPRDFTPSDLLINPTILPYVWKQSYDPEDVPCHLYDFQNCLQVSIIELRGPSLSIDHIVARFESSRDAAIAYNTHYFTRDKDGIVPFHWEPLNGFTYQSPIADQYRVVCNTETPNVGCMIEAQYEEYLSLLNYMSSNPEQAPIDLGTLARDIDAKTTQYLVK